MGITGRLKSEDTFVNPMMSVTAMTASVDSVSWTDALSLMNGSLGVLIVWITIVCEITPNMSD